MNENGRLLDRIPLILWPSGPLSGLNPGRHHRPQPLKEAESGPSGRAHRDRDPVGHRRPGRPSRGARDPADEPSAAAGFMGQKGPGASGGARSGEHSARSATKRAVIPGVFHDLGSEGAPRDTFDPRSCPGRRRMPGEYRKTPDLSWYFMLIPAHRCAGCRR